jgi:hypothetical protein
MLTALVCSGCLAFAAGGAHAAPAADPVPICTVTQFAIVAVPQGAALDMAGPRQECMGSYPFFGVSPRALGYPPFVHDGFAELAALLRRWQPRDGVPGVAQWVDFSPAMRRGMRSVGIDPVRLLQWVDEQDAGAPWPPYLPKPSPWDPSVVPPEGGMPGAVTPREALGPQPATAARGTGAVRGGSGMAAGPQPPFPLPRRPRIVPPPPAVLLQGRPWPCAAVPSCRRRLAAYEGRQLLPPWRRWLSAPGYPAVAAALAAAAGAAVVRRRLRRRPPADGRTWRSPRRRPRGRGDPRTPAPVPARGRRPLARRGRRSPWWSLALMLLSLGATLCPPIPVRGADLTWGYSYQRRRITTAPLAMVVPPAVGSPPRVVPLPGKSDSTPVVARRRWYLWTSWDRGRRGALWTGRLLPRGGSSAAVVVPLPGEHGATVRALAGESLDQPADAAISPDRRWIALGVGKFLYWWPRGDPAVGVRVTLSGPEPTEANSTSPTFVPDRGTASGWAVCTGNWNGAFVCYPVALGTFASPLSWYFVTMTDPADGQGYAPITSSAAYDPATGEVYFGVASWRAPRVIAMDPLTGAWRVLGAGPCGCASPIRAPVAAAVAVAGGSVYATDSLGDVYRFAARRGTLQAWFDAAPRPDVAPVNIVSPAVAPSVVYTLTDGDRDLLALAARTLQPLGRFTPVGAAGASALTVVTDPPAAPEVVYGLEAGGVGVAVPACALTLPARACDGGAGRLVPLGAWAGAPTDAGGYDFTAPVVAGTDILLWSDAATLDWRRAGDPGVGAAPAGPPARGGLEIYHMVSRLSAFVTAAHALAPGSVRTGGPRRWLYVLVPPGTTPRAVVRAPTGDATAIALVPDRAAAAAAPCPLDLSPAGAVGAFPFPGGPWSAAGCGPLAADYQWLVRDAAAQAGRPHPRFAGIPPRQWRDAGVPYAVWRAPLPVPAAPGLYRIAVAARMPDGAVARALLWYRAGCGEGARAAGAGCCAATACTRCAGGPDSCPPVLVPPRPCGGTGCVVSGCSMVGAQAELSREEAALVCHPPSAWLTDGAVRTCYGSWWGQLSRRLRDAGCQARPSGGEAEGSAVVARS